MRVPAVLVSVVPAAMVYGVALAPAPTPTLSASFSEATEWNPQAGKRPDFALFILPDAGKTCGPHPVQCLPKTRTPASTTPHGVPCLTNITSASETRCPADHGAAKTAYDKLKGMCDGSGYAFTTIAGACSDLHKANLPFVNDEIANGAGYIKYGKQCLQKYGLLEKCCYDNHAYDGYRQGMFGTRISPEDCSDDDGSWRRQNKAALYWEYSEHEQFVEECYGSASDESFKAQRFAYFCPKIQELMNTRPRCRTAMNAEKIKKNCCPGLELIPTCPANHS